jgi:hypothetical protein
MTAFREPAGILLARSRRDYGDAGVNRPDDDLGVHPEEVAGSRILH